MPVQRPTGETTSLFLDRRCDIAKPDIKGAYAAFEAHMESTNFERYVEYHDKTAPLRPRDKHGVNMRRTAYIKEKSPKNRMRMIVSESRSPSAYLCG